MQLFWLSGCYIFVDLVVAIRKGGISMILQLFEDLDGFYIV